MTLEVSLILLAPSLVLAGLFGWLGTRPHDHLKGPRLINWQVMMMIAAGICLALGVHIVALLRDGAK
ncbi:MAG TPA: hypothetical protein VII73_10045 [Caulobacteraceae bacterium]